MTDAAPKRIWVSAPNEDNEVETWTDPDEGGTEYILASEHAALIREAEVRGMNNGMLTAIEVVADERNKRNPGPLFEVLNKAIGKIEDARFDALRAAKATP